MKTLTIVLNTQSGAARQQGAHETLDQLKAAADWANITVCDASDQFDAAIEKACTTPSDYIAIAGGDGTAAAVLNAMVQARLQTPAIPLPLGTANLLPRRLYADRSPEEILRQTPGYEIKPLHAGAVDGQLFFVALMAGFPVRLGQAREALRPDDEGRQPVQALHRVHQALDTYLTEELSLEFDGVRTQFTDSANAVMTIPGGVDALIHGARPGEPALDTLVTRTRAMGDVVGALASWLGELVLEGALTVEQAREYLVLKGPSKLIVMVDGEPLTLPTPVTVTLEPNAARFAMPKDGS